VFIRYREVGVSNIHFHLYLDGAKPCKQILGYDANALYLSTMAKDTTCRKEKVNNYQDPTKAVQQVRSAVLSGWSTVRFHKEQTHCSKRAVA